LLEILIGKQDNSLMKHLWRIARQLCLKYLVCIPLTIIGVPILAVGLLTVDKNATTLPRWLKWFDNADDDGLIGDPANQERNRKRGIDPQGYIAKLLWLAFRNPINYFKYRVLGLKTSEIEYYTAIIEKSDIPGKPIGDYYSGGKRYIEVQLKDGSKAYEYYLVWPYRLLNRALCLRIRMGWKIGHPDEVQKPREYLSYAGTLNPVGSFKGTFKEAVDSTKNATSSDANLVVGSTHDSANKPTLRAIDPSPTLTHYYYNRRRSTETEQETVKSHQYKKIT
jgi:hypothetical protein